jgi:hydrogenase expression/formation protein HypE
MISGELAFTTDSFVVSPLFFPGGDIGTLAVYGTINDLAVAGARPRWISLSLILEEGLSMRILDRVLASVANAARECGVTVVTGDTKVVPRGAVDKLFINTSGIGEFVLARYTGPESLRPDDELLVSGPIGRHGVAIMAAREQLDFQPCPESDCAPLVSAVDALRQAKIPVKAMRDATRGGVAAVLYEWAAACDATMAVEEQRLPITGEVRGICELLGLDPLHVANEGTMVVAVPSGCAEAAIQAMHSVNVSSKAAIIGRVQPKVLSPVLVQRGLGRFRPLDEPVGAPLPRIC